MLWVHCNHRFIVFFFIFSSDQLALVNGTCCDLFIRSNLRLAQSGKFAINPLYPGGGTIIVKVMDFRLFESLKRALSRAFCSPKLSRGSCILNFLSENFPEYPPDKIIRISVIVYLLPQHFSWFENSPRFFCYCQNNKCFCEPGYTAHDEDGGHSGNART